MLKVIRHVIQGFLHLVYPPLCLHCKGSLRNHSPTFCDTCLSLLELIEPEERCPLCFSSDFCPKRRLCSMCSRKQIFLTSLAAAFEYVGPAATLIRKLKYSNQPYLSKGAGAYLAAQFLRLNWPMPDVIIPVPIAFTHKLERGYNQSLLLSESLGMILDRPFQEALKRKSGDYSQAGLSRKQRMQLSGESISLRRNQNLHDKCILLIDDVLTTGSTMQKCAEALLEDCPSTIYGLTVCKAQK